MTSAATTSHPREQSPSKLIPLVGLAALGLLAVVTTVVVAGSGRPLGVDVHLHHWVLAHRTTGLVHLAATVTWLGSGWVAGPLLFVGALAAAPGSAGQRLGFAAYLTVILATGSLLRLEMANQIARHRPPSTDWAASASGYAFPSGHTTGATLLAVLLAWAVMRRPIAGPGRAAAWILAVTCAAAVGWTRIYLGVHWPTDVLGGWTLGLGWACLGISLLGVARQNLAEGRRRA